MLKKRIIPCLDVKDGRVVKGVNFVNLRDAGDAVSLARKYSEEGADELVFLDISATNENRKTAADFAEKVAKVISLPFTIGGGISSLEIAREVLKAGADKIAINSAAVKNPNLILEMAEEFGSQAVVVAIDAKNRMNEGNSSHSSDWEVFVSGGKISTGMNVIEWAVEVEKLGAGEILLTSMDRDGTKSGFDIALTKALSEVVKIPVIASGGAQTPKHFAEVFEQTTATGALAASIFHFGEVEISELKQFLREQGVLIRMPF